MMNALSWVFFGLAVGVIAKLVMPGKDPGGFIVTVLLGVAGAFLGGAIGAGLGEHQAHPAVEWLLAIGGAVLLLAIYRLIARGRGATSLK